VGCGKRPVLESGGCAFRRRVARGEKKLGCGYVSMWWVVLKETGAFFGEGNPKSWIGLYMGNGEYSRLTEQPII